MTPRDQELLEKQLHGIDNRPPEGIFMLAFATVFFAGMAPPIPISRRRCGWQQTTSPRKHRSLSCRRRAKICRRR